MKYVLNEIVNNRGTEKNAGSKARIDVSTILNNTLDFKTLDSVLDLKSSSDGLFKKVENQFKKYHDLQETVKSLQRGDEIFIQFPILKQTFLLPRIFKTLKAKDVRINILVHDLETIRKLTMGTVSAKEKWQIKLTELSILKLADKVIVHNAKMKAKLVDFGINADKLIELKLFDYLIPDSISLPTAVKTSPIIIAGNLDPKKVRYLNSLPKNTFFNLYGVGYQDKGEKNVTYKGSFLPDDLISNLDGSFGLVWDGDSSDTCSGPYGNYLRFNNSHKTSLYLASGIPVLAWRESALADFIQKNNCGLLINSLSDINSLIEQLSDEEYNNLVINAKKIGEKLRDGYFLKTALK